MGQRGPRPMSDEARAARGGRVRDQRVLTVTDDDKARWADQAKRLEAAAMKLIEAKDANAREILQGRELLKRADALWQRVQRSGGLGKPSGAKSPDAPRSLAEFRKERPGA
jgi:hypothetical protein